MNKMQRIILMALGCIFIFTIVNGCKTSDGTICTQLINSNKQCLRRHKAQLDNEFMAYHLARKDKNVSRIIDSAITLMISNSSFDTVYIIENCNPPLYTYTAIIWNTRSSFTLYRSGVIRKGVIDDDRGLMMLIETWDEKNIFSVSHKKPLIYDGDWHESFMASRLIFDLGKCVNAETIFFSAIDMELYSTPAIIE